MLCVSFLNATSNPPTAATNGNVNVTITYPSDATTKQYRIDGGAWTTYTSAVAMTANGNIEARALDAAGNSSAIGTLNVANIDKTAPKVLTKLYSTPLGTITSKSVRVELSEFSKELTTIQMTGRRDNATGEIESNLY